MNWITIAAIYFVVWWLCLFIVLPIGVRTQDETEDMVPGTTESAPIRPMLVRKALATSVLAAIVVAAIWFAHEKLGLDIDALSRMVRP
jgi:predicted secreted protein